MKAKHLVTFPNVRLTEILPLDQTDSNQDIQQIEIITQGGKKLYPTCLGHKINLLNDIEVFGLFDVTADICSQRLRNNKHGHNLTVENIEPVK